ncbi:eukaryotic initiation factor 4a-ii [Anaeramoeba ignava]|uniref:RNA helicase n=1 Tax=Anaeramoeba ignava TaxID=1746090 RepID=A0A9Q0LCE2_ANAIG|nr:eukaryotic initiation factor 4a-ii [Anaeramoeba ignava]|eukprot:Anaeramoba_ignava/c20624_g2_i1.p1 GENE.c20624_g2_i1~~c20624_g2_i1.p1  ORF type:complete len:414 (+),score=135.40 c20624_g2_i1:36-1277(+)
MANYQNQNRYHRNRNYGRSRGRQYNDHKQEEIESNWDICVESFDKMGLKEELSRGIYGYGYEEPSIIQQKGIQPIIEGRDVIGQAQSGTGKTATFAIGVLQKIERNYLTQALILAPTRELASQIGLVVEGLSEYMDVKSYVCIGGTDVEKDKEMLRKGQNIIVGTPGRVIHMIIDEHLKTENIKMLIMDEADELLSRGFKDQIYQIFQELPKDVQVLLFSATMPRDVLEVTKKFMRDPAKILVKKEELTLQGITQFYVDVRQANWKFGTLCDLYKTISVTQCLIFCNKKEDVEDIAKQMLEKDFVVYKMHGEMEPREREQIMRMFRKGKARVLITTDLLSRGIDVQQVSLVINYDLPQKKESYIHRIGRSGRFGRKGVAINFVTEEDFSILKDIQTFYSTQIEEMPGNIADYL